MPWFSLADIIHAVGTLCLPDFATLLCHAGKGQLTIYTEPANSGESRKFRTSSHDPVPVALPNRLLDLLLQRDHTSLG